MEFVTTESVEEWIQLGGGLRGFIDIIGPAEAVEQWRDLAHPRRCLQEEVMNTYLHQLKQGALLVVLSFALGSIDWIIGYELNFSVFYFLPVSLAAWSFGAPGSVALAVICSMIWYAADFLSDHTYSNTLYAVWDTILRLISFLAIGWAVASLKKNLDIEKETARKLRASLSEIKVLESFLPICSQCKKIRDEQGAWHQMETYISRRTDTRFSHGYCPDCFRKALSEAGLPPE